MPHYYQQKALAFSGSFILIITSLASTSVLSMPAPNTPIKPPVKIINQPIIINPSSPLIDIILPKKHLVPSKPTPTPMTSPVPLYFKRPLSHP